MTEPASAHDADALYRPLAGVEAWAEAPVDGDAWAGGLARLAALAGDEPACLDMLRRGALLAAAHESGALDGMHAGDRRLALALLRGEASPADLEPRVRAHVVANDEALRLTGDELGSEAWVRRVHQVACRPQLTHHVHDEHGAQDHVLAAGDYKHHPNHVLTAPGTWRAFAPVAALRGETARLAERLTGPAFAGMHPVAQAACAHDGVAHVGPFADGNGRVSRAVAGAYLRRAASVPLLVFADERRAYDEALAATPVDQVAFVLRRCLDLIGLMEDAQPRARASDAFDRWRRREDLAERALTGLPAAVDRALARHRRRPDLGWLSPLDGAVVGTTGKSVVVRAPAGPGPAVEEVVAVDPHPVSGHGRPVLRAVQAGLGLELGFDGPDADLRDAWLDRVVSCLALRVAADLE